MQVHYDEGIANRIGPEPCAGIREDVGEASVGERTGQPLSRDRKLIPGADAVCVAEGNMSKSANASAWAIRRCNEHPYRERYSLCEGGGSATGVHITDRSHGPGGDGSNVALFLGSTVRRVNTRGKISDRRDKALRRPGREVGRPMLACLAVVVTADRNERGAVLRVRIAGED